MASTEGMESWLQSHQQGVEVSTVALPLVNDQDGPQEGLVRNGLAVKSASL
jgi:hypothetical protein